MSYSDVFQVALTELSLVYDMSVELIESLRKSSLLKEQCQFVCMSLDIRQKNLLESFKKTFHFKVNEIDSSSERQCGFIVKCYGNGYREFCDLPEHNHDEKVMKAHYHPHVYQKKNINNIIDSKYQNGIMTICNFISQIKVTLVHNILKEALLTDSKIISVEYQNGKELWKYDTLMQDNPDYFRLNYLVDGKVTYWQKSLNTT